MKDCSRHLKEAIELNTERLLLYAKLSGGETIPYSKKLIWYEQLALKGAWIFDQLGKRYQQKGIDYMKNEFVEMATASPFYEQYPAGIDFAKPLELLHFTSFMKQAKQLNKQQQFEQLVELCNMRLHQLEKQTHVYCMVRHLIESIRRMAFLIPTYEAPCEAQQLKSPMVYSQFLIRLQLMMLPKSAVFDIAIAPIQQQNIPFLYQDLPPISLGDGLLL